MCCPKCFPPNADGIEMTVLHFTSLDPVVTASNLESTTST